MLPQCRGAEGRESVWLQTNRSAGGRKNREMGPGKGKLGEMGKIEVKSGGRGKKWRKRHVDALAGHSECFALWTKIS